MAPSHFEAPTDVEAAIALLSRRPGARPLAGGTDLLVQLRLGAATPDLFVDLKRIPRLMATSLDSKGLTLGAAVPAAEIVENASIRSLWPGLVEATALIGSSQIQGRATWGGNLCNASPAADAVPAMIVCGAKIVLAGPGGEREVLIEDFTTGPGETLLERGELVVEFRVPAPAPRSADAYLRVTPRSEMDIAVVGVGVQLELDREGRVASARVALGAVAPTAVRADAAAEALVGSRLDDAALDRAAVAASTSASPIDDRRGTAAYRKSVVGVLTKRAARIAYERAQAR
ncbi:MAG: xanthine dehydrogenase family protein subunit M [Deltaproteobacteria bacterium]|nr:xanthine dehydrogenase family protein subunit M [Deltaproteobacteria bacterium]